MRRRPKTGDVTTAEPSTSASVHRSIDHRTTRMRARPIRGCNGHRQRCGTSRKTNSRRSSRRRSDCKHARVNRFAAMTAASSSTARRSSSTPFHWNVPSTTVTMHHDSADDSNDGRIVVGKKHRRHCCCCSRPSRHQVMRSDGRHRQQRRR